MAVSDTSVKICGLCEDIKDAVGNLGTDLMVIDLAQEIIHEIRAKNCGWEHLWDAPDGTFKGRCKNCGFVHHFIEGHETQYKFCPQCGDQKRI